MVDLYGDEACLVTVTPKALKNAIEQQIPTVSTMSNGLSPHCLKAPRESSRTPEGHN